MKNYDHHFLTPESQNIVQNPSIQQPYYQDAFLQQQFQVPEVQGDFRAQSALEFHNLENHDRKKIEFYAMRRLIFFIREHSKKTKD